MSIAIIGAHTLIGHEILNCLSEIDNAPETVYALTPKRETGKAVSYGEKDLETTDQDIFDYASVKIVFYAGDTHGADVYIDKALSLNAKVIDCTGASFLNDKHHDNLIAIPSPRSLILSSVLKPLMRRGDIKRICVTTMEAASGEGKDGMDELFNQCRKFFVSDGMDNNVFAKQIAFNVIPQVEDFGEGGHTHAEKQTANEMKILLGDNVSTSVTCMSVPVFMGHGFSVNVEFNAEMDAKTARNIWTERDNILVIERESEMKFVTPIEIAGEDSLFISRVRDDKTLDNGISFWCVADNIRYVALQAISNI
jgi:aspartate-semialdehyde dehydrogenase